MLHETIPGHRVCPEFLSLGCKWCGSANLRTLATQCGKIKVMFSDEKVARQGSLGHRAWRASDGENQSWLSPIKLRDSSESRP